MGIKLRNPSPLDKSCPDCREPCMVSRRRYRGLFSKKTTWNLLVRANGSCTTPMMLILVRSFSWVFSQIHWMAEIKSNVPLNAKGVSFRRCSPQQRFLVCYRGTGFHEVLTCGFGDMDVDTTVSLSGNTRPSVTEISMLVDSLEDSDWELSFTSHRLFQGRYLGSVLGKSLFPDGRVVEHAVSFHVEVAVEYHLTTGSDVILLPGRHHQHFTDRRLSYLT